MYPIAGRFGPFLFYSYTVCMGAGLLAMAGLAVWRLRRSGRSILGAWWDAFFVALAMSLVGGRLAYVAAHPVYFRAHPGEAWLLARGGLSYHGALFAGLLGLATWCRWRGLSLGAVSGLLAPGAALWSAFGWLACWLEACAYGRETYLGPLAAALPDSYGLYAVRYQSQLLGLLLSLVAFALLWRWRERMAPIALSLLAVVLLSGGRFVVGWLRGDPMPAIGGLRLDVIIDGTVATVALLYLIIRNEGLNESRDRPGRLPARP